MAMNSGNATHLRIQEFNAQNVVQELKKAHQNGRLLHALKHHFCAFVPCVYKSGPASDAAAEERKAKKFLFSPVEHFMCDGDPGEVFKKLKEQDNPPQLCGRVFKVGEPTYSCRDCAVDPTCVLCINCFQNGAHKNHRYKMNMSGGGGYCDCGDVEAWKSDYVCDTHKKGQQQQQTQRPVDKLPEELRKRISDVLRTMIHFAVELLLWEAYDKLPVGLEPEQPETVWITMLFNDEVHTYEQVISALQSAIDCTHKEAVDFATIVDREGRSGVRYGTHANCEKAKGIIERNTSRRSGRPLKCEVMSSSVVAHQTFAQRTLSWVQELIGHSESLRQLFCMVAMEAGPDGQSVLEKIMLADTKLWKSARVLSHQLFMSGVLMEQEFKKKFAILFTQLYPKLMKCYIEDDHDHSVSVASLTVQIYTVTTMHYPQLVQAFIKDDHYRSVSATGISVQIFTVPTLARMLIKEHNLLSVILKTFLKECEGKKNTSGLLEFDRNRTDSQFKRAQYILYDLKYALNACPTGPGEWDSDLRRNFLSGLSCFLDLLSAMEGMDAVQRETGQHMEFEPEWEGAFNLQLKLEDNIQLIIDWCATEKEVLIAAYRAILERLFNKKQSSHLTSTEITVTNHSVECLKFQVASGKVSIHHPVTRLLSGLSLLLDKFGISFYSAEIQEPEPKLSALDLVEYPLQCQVLIAQMQAGMWRRNGFSLINQVYFYQNVRCRTQMYDKDIIMLQYGASLMDSNHFLVNCIYKFGLTHWIKEEYDTPGGTVDDAVRHRITLAEEFLNLLVVILSERYTPGVGQVTDKDRVKHEVIHQLCIEPTVHSKLTKALPEDINHETGIESVVHEVAEFKKKQGIGKGMYELKEEFYKEYNPNFYHYSKSDQSKSEEEQRKRKKLAKEDQALPPPVPPALTPGFAGMTGILQCDTMLHIIRLVLSRAMAAKSRSFSEVQLEKVLHLIGLAIHEERSAHEKGESSFRFTEKALHVDTSGRSVHSLLENLVGHSHITHDSLKDLIAWVVKAFAQVRSLRDDSVAMDTSEGTSKSPSSEARSKMEKKKKEMAARRRARIMAQMSKMQKNFIEENAELFENTEIGLAQASSDMDLSHFSHHECPVAVGPQRTPSAVTTVPKHTCILCQEEHEITHNGRAMVLAGFVQRSTVLSKSRGKVIEDKENHDPLFMPPDLFCGQYTSTCGHVMHADCWKGFFDSLMSKYMQRAVRYRRSLSYDINKGHFLCPLCETVSNTVIPIIPPLALLLKERPGPDVSLSLSEWLDVLQKVVRGSIKKEQEKDDEEKFFLEPCPLPSVTKMVAESVARNFNMVYEYITASGSDHFSNELTEMIRKFANDAYATGLDVLPDSENKRVAGMPWSTTSYTIQVIEQSLRDEGKPLFGALTSRQLDCLNGLLKITAVCGQVIKPEVVKQDCVRLLAG